MTSAFLEAWGITLGHEAGYSNHPADPGGRTMHGITERDHPDLFRDGLPTLAQAQRRAYEQYWLPCRLDDIRNPVLREEVFDSAYNCGVKNAGKFLQRAYNMLVVDVGWKPLAEDGVIGPKTVQAVNRFLGKSPDWALALYKWTNWQQGLYYTKVNNPQMIRGWAKRL